MKLKDVLEIAVIYLGLTEEITLDGSNATPLTDKTLHSLIKCANIVYGELASDYFPLTKEVAMTFTDNKLEYSLFPERIIDIDGVYVDNTAVPFRLYPSYLYAEVPVATVRYSYLPSELKLDDEIEYGIKVNPRLFALGIAGEYCLINAMYEEGLSFDRKYRDAIRSAKASKGERRVKERRW